MPHGARAGGEQRVMDRIGLVVDQDCPVTVVSARRLRAPKGRLPQGPSHGCRVRRKRHRARRATRASRNASEWTFGSCGCPARSRPSSRAGAWDRRISPPRSGLPALALIGAPLRVAPLPAMARNNSSVTGAKSAATTGRPPSPAPPRSPSRAGRRDKARVPSIGSTIQTPRAASRAGSSSRLLRQPAGVVDRRCSRSRSSASTAMSASLTGDDLPLVQLLSGTAKGLQRERAGFAHGGGQAIAQRPRDLAGFKARQRSVLPPARSARWCRSGTRDRSRATSAEHVDQMSGDRHLADRIGELAVLDPEAGGAAAVVAGHHVDAHADQVGRRRSPRRCRRSARRASTVPGSRWRLVGPGEGVEDTPRWAWPVVARPSSRAVALSRSQVVSTPSSTSASALGRRRLRHRRDASAGRAAAADRR